MTPHEMQSILSKVKYKDGWDLYFHLGAMGPTYLQWHMIAPDYTHPDKPLRVWPCRKHQLSFHMTESELVQTAFFAALQAEEHECREAFTYQDKAVFNPHISVQALLSVCGQQEVRA